MKSLVPFLLGIFSLLAHAQSFDGKSINGAFSVSSSGSATYAIDLKAAPGTAGSEPQLSLRYSSQASQGELGAGWSISGFSVISRGARTVHTDGKIAGVNLDDDDALFLDGQRIVPVERNGTGAATRIVYRKEVDDLTRITQTDDKLGLATFLVETKGGARILFDGSNNSRVKVAGGQTLLLAASEVQDTAGNFIQFLYSQGGDGDYHLTSVRYTGHHARSQGATELAPYAAVDFSYEAIARPVPAYVAGQLVERKYRLKQVVARISPRRDIASSPGVQVARYAFEYEERDSLNGFVLKTVRQFDETDSVQTQPTTMEYSPLATGWTAATHTLPITALAVKEDLSAGYRFSNIFSTNGGRPDLLFAVQIDGRLESFAYRNDPTGWTAMDDFRPPFAFITGEGKDAGGLLLDVDGDGKADLLQANKQSDGSVERRAWLSTASNWAETPAFALPFNLAENGERTAIVLTGRWSGGRGPDLLYTSTSGSGFLASDGNGWKADGAHVPPVALTKDALLIDVDCDGKPELVLRDPQSPGKWLVYRYTAPGWTAVTAAQFAIPIDSSAGAAAIRQIDLNGDGCLDIVASSQKVGIHASFLASASGWTAAPAFAPPFDLVDAAGNPSNAVVADVNGDGRPEVLASRHLEGSPDQRFAFGFDAGGWHALPAAFQVNAPLADSELRAYVGDLDGDGIADIAVPEGSRNGFGQVYRGTATGLVETPTLSPRVAFARHDRQDRGVRFIDLNGDGLTDVLYSRDGTSVPGGPPAAGAFINTASGWIPAPGLIPPLPLAGDKIAGDPAQFVDVDNDGYVDLLYSYRRADGSVVAAYYKNVPDGAGGRKWEERKGSPLIPPVPFAAEQVGDLGVRMVDLNGDGRIDILQSTVTKLANGQQVPVEKCIPPGSGANCDLDRTLFRGAAFLNTSSGWQQAAAYTSPLPIVALGATGRERSDSVGVELVDVNGDGLADVVARFKHPLDPTREVNEVWYNTGSGWTQAPTSARMPVLLDETSRNRFAMVQWTDLNGDGLADLVYTERAGGLNRSVSWLSTGRRFVASAAWQVPLDALSDKTGDPSFRLVDLNGDGLPDILYSRKLPDGSVARGAWFNSGTGWTAAPGNAIAAVPAFIDENSADQGLRLIDVNGDGLLDAVQSYAPQGGAVAQQSVLLNTGRRADVLRKVDQGNGISTAVFYQTLLEADPERATGENANSTLWGKVYQRAASATALPLISPVPTSYVVRRVVTSEGAGRDMAVSYRYGDYEIDTEAMRSLGFGWREAFDETSQVLTRTEYGRSLLVANRPVREASCAITSSWLSQASRAGSNLCPASAVPGIQLLAETTSNYGTRMGTAQPASGAQFKFWQVAVNSTSRSLWELDGKLASRETSTITYDEPADLLTRWLEVQQTVTTRSDGTSVSTGNNVYAQDDPANWFLGRLTSSTVTQTDNGGSGGAKRSEVRTSAFSYDSETGLIASETLDDGAPKAVTKTFERDEFGNVVVVQITTAGVARRNEIGFDPLRRFAIESRIVTPQRTYRVTTQSRLQDGAPLLVTDEDNQIKKSFRYDGFGRPVLATDNSGLQAVTKYLRATDLHNPAALAGIPAVNAVWVQKGILPPIIALLDGRGRTVRTVSEGYTQNPSDRRPLYQETSYDRLGRPVATAVAHDSTASPRWERIEYDVLNRIVKRTAADGQVTLTSYAGRSGGGRVITVSLQGASPRSTITEVNGRNLPGRVTDTLRGATTYAYDPADRVEAIVGPTGSITRMKYELGQRTELVDPDLGRIRYEYDGLGQLVALTDAENTRFTFTHDELGRVTSKVGGGLSLHWEFDATQFGIGRLTRMWDNRRFEKSYTYDANGDVATETMKVGPESFTTTYERDQYRRVTRTVYPVNPSGQPVAANNRYDAKGYLYRVTDDSGARPYWQALQIDQSGRVTDASMGEGVRTRAAYDAQTDRLSSMSATAVDNSAIMSLTLDYDATGNVRRRREGVQKVDETFGYDDLDRLTSMTGAGAPLTFRYDNGGRLRQLGPASSFAYWRDTPQGEWQPEHAVTSTMTGGVVSRYHYDANGNRDKGLNGATYGYTDDNRLASIRLANGDTSTFEYAPDGTRFRQVQTVGGEVTETVYVGAYERISQYTARDPGKRQVTYRYFLAGPDGVFGALQVRARQTGNSASVTDPLRLWLVIKDQLGSAVAVTDGKGAIAARFWYGAWGHRTRADLTTLGDALGATWTMGFGGHEHLVAFGLIHMNGRVYDPSTGMFLSADPVGADAGSTQTIGRYLFANDNPLRYIDPSGYWSLGGAIVGGIVGFVTGGPGGAIVGAFLGGNDDTRHWIQQNWKEVAITTVAIAATVATAGAASPILAGMIVGAISGATSAILYGGNLNDVLFATVRGAVIGGITAGAFNAVGTAFVGAEHSVGAIAAHGVVGGGINAMQGGNFWKGFAAAAATKASSSIELESTSANMARAALVGGTVAEINGEKFANGAILGLYSYTFNDLAHRTQWVSRGAAFGIAATATGSLVIDASTGGLNILATPGEIAFGGAAGGAIAGYLYDVVYSEGGPILPDFDFYDPSKPPVGADGKTWPWVGNGPPGSATGGYKNPSNPGQSIHPDLNHPPGVEPHWDFNDRYSKQKQWRIDKDKNATPK